MQRTMVVLPLVAGPWVGCPPGARSWRGMGQYNNMQEEPRPPRYLSGGLGFDAFAAQVCWRTHAR